MIHMALPDFGDEAHLRMMLDLLPSPRPVDIARTHQHTFTVDALGFGHVQVRGMRRQQRQCLLEIQTEVKTGH